MLGLQSMKRIYIQWVTVQQLLFGMVMLSAKQHSVFGTQSREFNEYKGVSACLQCTACWINPTEIAWPEPWNRNMTNAPFHDDIYINFLKPFSTITVSCIFSRETSVKANQKKRTKKRARGGWDSYSLLFEGHMIRNRTQVLSSAFRTTRSPWQNSRTWQHCNSLTARNKVIARRQSDNWRLPKKAAPKTPSDWLLHFPAKYKTHDKWKWW